MKNQIVLLAAVLAIMLVCQTAFAQQRICTKYGCYTVQSEKHLTVEHSSSQTVNKDLYFPRKTLKYTNKPATKPWCFRVFRGFRG